MDGARLFRRWIAVVSSVPISRALLVLAIAGPAFWLGGAPVAAVLTFAAVAFLAGMLVWWRSKARIRLPWGVVIGGGLGIVTLVQIVPFPEEMRRFLAPGIEALREQWVMDVVTPWPSVSPVPADTLVEALRLLALSVVFMAAAQFSWRLAAVTVASLGTILSIVGFAHRGMGMTRLWGVFTPHQGYGWHAGDLVTPFVNPNHLGGVLLLGVFATVALMLVGGPPRSSRRAMWLGMVAAGVQVAALVESESRAAWITLLASAPLTAVVAFRVRSRRRLGTMSKVTALLASAGVGIAALLFEVGPGAGTVAADVKLQLASKALGLVPKSSWLGIGRGAFVDLYPALDERLGPKVFRHLESLPATFVVEWGPWCGGVALATLAVWWVETWRKAQQAPDGRIVALIGLGALAVQNMADFGLEMVGVAAPACALAGGLAPKSRRRVLARTWVVMTVFLFAGLLGAAMMAKPYTWPRRESRNRAVSEGSLVYSQELRWRPLDPQLHRSAARIEAQRGRWDQALRRAQAAVDLQPAAADGWLLLGAAKRAHGDRTAMHLAFSRALARLDRPASSEFLRYLVELYPRSADWVSLLPSDFARWDRVVRPLGKEHPVLADEIAQRFQQDHPRDPRPLWFRAELALRAEAPALALHHARLSVQLEPDRAHSYRMVARSHRSFRPPREREAQRVLVTALERLSSMPANELNPLRELLVESLMATGTAEDREHARRLLPALLDGSNGDPVIATRRRELARKVHRTQ